jgi:divalent metal cation (Fe/Co/Zn/Cd) transporter
LEGTSGFSRQRGSERRPFGFTAYVYADVVSALIGTPDLSRIGVASSSMESTALPLGRATARDPERERLIRRARMLAWLGIGWHGVEATVAIAAGVVAGSIALVGFGADSLIESAAGFVLLWRFAASRSGSDRAERRAQRLIGLTFYVLASYIAIEAVRNLIGGDHAEASLVGIALAAFTVVTMPVLATAKERVAERLGSSATKAEGRQNMVCAYLSGALLIGLTANALAGWWWADPATALLIAAVAVREGREAWRGDSCCAAPIGDIERADDCCG